MNSRTFVIGLIIFMGVLIALNILGDMLMTTYEPSPNTTALLGLMAGIVTSLLAFIKKDNGDSKEADHAS